uniref:RING-type domain-containing protein n=1 Tax=Oryza brachyantha TaxID=4533 RepID=J3MJZ3_ORYBR
MDDPNFSQENAHQPSGQQNNFSSFTSPTNHVLGNHMDGPYQVNSSPLLIFLEQRRRQLDHVLQIHNMQLRMSLQHQVSSQNSSILNLVDSLVIDALRQKNDELARLRTELNQLQQFARTLEQSKDFWVCFAEQKTELLDQLFSKMDHEGLLSSSNEMDAGSSSHIVNLEVTSIERTQPNMACKCCNSHSASMLILPCQHFCACKTCATHIATCPICNSPKDGLIEARFD